MVYDRPNHNPMLIGAGDVIDVVPDGHQWAPDELNLPQLRIFRLRNVTVENAVDLLAKQASNPDFYKPRRRHFFVDRSKMTGSLAAFWDDDSRAVKILEVTNKNIRDVLSVTPEIPLDQVLGETPVLG